MKKVILMFIIGVFLFFTADAQTRKNEQAKAWKQFQTAIARNDKTALAAMIEFPFEASIVGSDLEYKIESKMDLVKYCTRIFTAARRKQVARGRIAPIDGEDEFGFEMSEAGGYQVFTFRKIGGAYKLISTMAAG